ncbi:MAG: efflux RND transporter permease subunit [Pseudomonadales bacterium]|nr:efflux RND transporter permease subunit [Pseudomonadales bacterium]
MQSIVRFIVTNRSFTVLFFLIIALAAWIQLPGIRISQYPVVELPTLMVHVVLPGASATEIEQRVINKIEEKLQSVRNLDEVITEIHNSYAWITITYDYGIDVDEEYTDLNARINNIKTDLPPGTEVVVQKRSPVDFIVSFVLGISSDLASPAELRQVSRQLTRSLRQLKSIENVEEVMPEEEIAVDLDLARMEVSRIDIAAIAAAIRGNNQYLPTGVFEIGDKALTVLAFDSGYQTLDELRQTMLINREGKPLALSDVATVRKIESRDALSARIDGNPAVLITMKLSKSANIFDARAAIADAIARLDKPDTVRIDWLFDAESGVNDKLEELTTNILQGVAILAVVLVFAVGLRSAFTITMMLPAALLLSIIGLSFTEYGIQEISLAGFIIALGLIVDNGIVVTENAYKLNHYGHYSHEESAILGTSSVLMPLFSSTATTALAFAPLFLLTSPTGLFLHSLVAVIWLCLGASLVAALIISSVMLARIGTENRVPFLPSPPSFLIALIPFRDNTYKRTLSYFIRHPFQLLALVILLLGITGVVASRLPIIIFPDSEDPYFTVNIEAPLDRNSEFVDDLAARVSDVVSGFPMVERCSTMTGGSFPLVSTGISRVPVRRNNAQIFCAVSFRNAAQLSSLIQEINHELKPFAAEADIKASQFIVGAGAELADIEIHVVGDRIGQLRSVALELESKLKASEISGINSINNEAQNRYFALGIDFEERKASALGVTRAAVDQVLMLITHGQEIDQLRASDGKEYPIVLRAESAAEDPLNIFDRIFVNGKQGARIPLSQVVSLTFREDEYDVWHNELSPRVSIDVYADDGVNVTLLTDQVRDTLATMELPDGVRIAYKGQAAEQADAFGGMGKYVGIIGLTILGIFVFQFGSVMQPLIICAAIPLSFIGAFLLLYPTGQPISFLAFIGLTSLMGIVINNSILLVDEGNHLRDLHHDLSMAEVAIQSGLNRFMPILLTSVTSIVGLLPLAAGDSMFRALAIVVIGGLATSTFLTLICLPVLYAYVTKPNSRVVLITDNWNGKSELGEMPAEKT